MPSCDGSNCGACACNCNTVKKIVYRDNPELLKKIKQLEDELKKAQQDVAPKV